MAEEQLDLTLPERKPEEPELPRCVICGRREGTAKVYVQSATDLAPGIREGVCHEQCLKDLPFRKKSRKRRRRDRR